MIIECNRCDKEFDGEYHVLFCKECRKEMAKPVKRIIKKEIKGFVNSNGTCCDCGKKIKGKIGKIRCHDCYLEYAKHHSFGLFGKRKKNKTTA